MALSDTIRRISLANQIRLAKMLGSRVLILRADPAATVRGPDGSVATRQTWNGVLGAGIGDTARMILSPATQALVQRVWGDYGDVTMRGTCPDNIDVQDGDGVVVIDGLYVGGAYLVRTSTRDALAASRDLALALSTTETFVG